MRPVAALDLPDLKPADLSGKPLPMLEWLPVDDLWIDPAYQRDIGAASLKLIAALIEGWDWLKMAPILVAMTDNGLEVIDGQNRVTAAKMHPGITKVPCYVVDGSTLPERAGAFVSHARNRVPVTPGQIFHAEVAAGDEDALTVEAVCKRAGVRILPYSPPFGTRHEVGDTTALASIKGLVGRRGAMRSREILEALVQAGLAPIPAALIRAGEAICTESEYAAEFGPEQLTAVLRALGSGAQSEVKALAAAKCLPAWRAWVAVLFKHRRAKPKAEVARPAPAAAPPPARRIIDNRPSGSITAAICGDPTPGRSALDQRKGVH